MAQELKTKLKAKAGLSEMCVLAARWGQKLSWEEVMDCFPADAQASIETRYRLGLRHFYFVTNWPFVDLDLQKNRDAHLRHLPTLALTARQAQQLQWGDQGVEEFRAQLEPPEEWGRLDGSDYADECVVRHYLQLLEQGVRFPPCLLGWSETHIYLADGWHRFNAWNRLGLAGFPAILGSRHKLAVKGFWGQRFRDSGVVTCR